MPDPFAPLGPANVSCGSHVEMAEHSRTWQNVAEQSIDLVARA